MQGMGARAKRLGAELATLHPGDGIDFLEDFLTALQWYHGQYLYYQIYNVKNNLQTLILGYFCNAPAEQQSRKPRANPDLGKWIIGLLEEPKLVWCP